MPRLDRGIQYSVPSWQALLPVITGSPGQAGR